MPRTARCLLLAILILPVPWRGLPPRPARACAPEGRGSAPRRWLGCATDAGPRRDLAGDERLLLGLPLELNRATARELSFVPGIGASLAEAVVVERERAGGFVSSDDLLRIHGIGPRRLAQARPFVVVSTARDAVAPVGE